MDGRKLLLFSFLFLFLNTGHAQMWPTSLVGQWTFDNLSDLTHATVGNDLLLNGTQTVVAGIVPGDGAVAIGVGSYYTCIHGIPANGSGTMVNKYSMMFDFRVPDVTIYHCFFQTSITNSDDGESLVNPTGNIGVGVTGNSGFSVPQNTWHRLVITVDLGRSFKYWLDGHLILNGTNQAVDNRFALRIPKVLFFADDNGEDNLICISQIALFNATLTEQEVLGLDGLVTSNIMPYLQTPAPNSMYISWNSYNTASTIVRFGTTPSLGNSNNGTYEDIAGNLWHTVKLAGLQPNTRYYYRCISGNDSSAVYPFRTPAIPGTPGAHVRFAIISDSQYGVTQSNITADSLLATFISKYGQNWYDSVTMVMHTGDITQDGTSIGRYMNEYFNSFYRLSCSVPFMVSIGNHEFESSYYYSFMKYEELSDFPLPDPLNEKFYSFSLGTCKFIIMNTNGLYNNTIQTNWLHDKLVQSDQNPECDFVFVVNHQPGHSEIWPDGNTAYVQNNVYGELVQFPKVTLCSHGHTHAYERGVIRTDNSERCDFRITIAGGAGGPLDRWGMYPNQTDYPEIQRSLDYYHYLILDVNESEKVCTAEMYSLGNPDKTVNNVIMDRWHRLLLQSAPAKPVALRPDSIATSAPVLITSSFIGVDSLMSSRFQLTTLSGNWNSPLTVLFPPASIICPGITVTNPDQTCPMGFIFAASDPTI